MRYVPVLKGKEGEFAALESLGLPERDGLVPLIELPGVPYDHAKEEDAKTIDQHLSGLGARIRKSWHDGPLFLDLRLCESLAVADGRNALSVALADCVAQHVDVRPVVTTFSCADYKTAATNFLAASRSGACIRLLPDNFDEERDLHADLDDLLGELRLRHADVDLMVDHGALPAADRSTNVQLTRARFQAVPDAARWRTLILAGTSFPPDLSDVEAQTIERLPRREWDLWEALQRRPNQLPRADLVFADYVISHPVSLEVDPRMMRMSASIRYTAETCWLIVKGRNVRQHGFEQYFDLCRRLIQEPEYKGRTYSWGDGFIANCAEESQGPGNATTWRKVGTNHHLTLVCRQLANAVEL